MPESIGPYVTAALRLAEADFVRAHPEPVFVLAPLARTEQTGAVTRVAHGGPGAAVIGFEVVPLRKRAGANQFKSMITVGRSSACDIELRAPEVSKSHAYLVIDGDVRLTDTGSTNGTQVNGVKLDPKSTRTLSAGDKVSFGGAAAVTFHDPVSFYTFLRTVGG